MEEKKSNICVCLEVGGNNGGFSRCFSHIGQLRRGFVQLSMIDEGSADGLHIYCSFN